MPIASFRTKLQLPLEQPIHTGPQMELKNAYFQAIRSPLIDAQSKSQRHLKNWFCYYYTNLHRESSHSVDLHSAVLATVLQFAFI